MRYDNPTVYTAGVLAALAALAVVIAVSLYAIGHAARAGARLRWRYAATVAGCIVLILGATQAVSNYSHQTMLRETVAQQRAHDAETFPQENLLQCGDEIPLMSDARMFRVMRDAGFRLVASVPTRLSDGTINVDSLCSTYDELRKTYGRDSLALGLYSKLDDGKIVGYEYSYIDSVSVTSSYGFFAKP